MFIYVYLEVGKLCPNQNWTKEKRKKKLQTKFFFFFSKNNNNKYFGWLLIFFSIFFFGLSHFKMSKQQNATILWLINRCVYFSFGVFVCECAQCPSSYSSHFTCFLFICFYSFSRFSWMFILYTKIQIVYTIPAYKCGITSSKN